MGECDTCELTSQNYQDYDQHHLRDLTFTGDQGNRGRMQGVALTASYQFSPRLAVKAGVDYQVNQEAKGSTLVRHVEGSQITFGGNAGSQSARTVRSSLAVNTGSDNQPQKNHPEVVFLHI